MIKILILCTGNLCRSPLAEGYLRRLLEDNGIEGVVVQSAGVAALSDEPACEPARQVAKLHGFSINGHIASQVTAPLLQEVDEVLVMERFQKEVLIRAGVEPDKIHLLGEFSSEAGAEIDDPYGSDLEFYEQVFSQIKEAVDAFFKQRIIRGGAASDE